MDRKKLLSVGLTLFSLSFLFIFAGLYLDYREKQSFSDPINDVEVIASESDDIIISTTGEDGDRSFDNSSNGDKNNDPNDNQNGSNINNNDTGTNTNTNTDTNASTGTNPTGDISGSNTNENLGESSPLEKSNEIARKTIESTYGIKVKDGADTNGYSAGNMGTVAVVDPIRIEKAINQLNHALSLYPTGFFREFNDVSLSLEIYLIQRYNQENVTGVTDLSGNKVIISIALDYPFAESFHHEIYHYIEHFIERKHGEFSNWNTYNPKDFKYGVAQDGLSYNRTKNPLAPFVNNYAQTNADEDRASLFEYMTADHKVTCFDSMEYPIWKKSSYVALMIDTYFETVNPSIVDYWERFIY